MKARGFIIGLALAALVWVLATGCAGRQVIKQTHLPWLEGQTVEVRLAGWSQNAEAIRGMAEASFKARGVKVLGTSRYPYQQTYPYPPRVLCPPQARYVAEIYLERRDQTALVEIRLMERATNVVVATGRGSSFINYWGTFSYSYGYATYYDEFAAVEVAARLALANLH